MLAVADSVPYDDAADVDFDDGEEYLNMRNSRIIQVSQTINDSDAVNKRCLGEQLLKMMDKLDDDMRKA